MPPISQEQIQAHNASVRRHADTDYSNQKGQAHSYTFGCLTHADAATREQALAHNLECIDIGQRLGGKALSVWVGDGSNFPILQRMRAETGGAIDPVGAYRASGYRQQLAKDRPAVTGSTGGIV